MFFRWTMRYKSFSLLIILSIVLLLTGCSRNVDLSRQSELKIKSNLLFVCNAGSDYVSVIDADNNTVYASFEARQPWGITFSRDRKRGYATCVGSGQLKVINGYNFIPIDYINVGLSSPVGVIVNSSLDRAYVVRYAFDSLLIVDLNRSDWAGEITLGDGPQWAVISTDESKVYVVNTKSDTLSVVDLAAGDVSKSIPLPYYSYGVTRSPHDHKIYVASFATISIIDPANDNLEENIVVGGGAKSWIEFSNVSNHAYISDLSYDKVIVYDLGSREVIQEIPVDDGPHCMVRNGDGSKIYVSCAYSDTVDVINTMTNTVEAKISVGNTPIGLYFRD